MRLIAACLCWAAVSLAFPLVHSGRLEATAAPRIIIHIPDAIPSEAVWIRYMVRGPGESFIELVERHSNVHQYTLFTNVRGGSATEARVVAYVPSCQFQTYDVDLSGAREDILKEFVCVPLPSRTIRAFLPPAKIPKPLFTRDTKVDVYGELEDHLVCEFLLTQARGSSFLRAGSCLGAPIPLGKVGEIDPADGGVFRLLLPDFLRDPFLKRDAEASPEGLGDIEFGLRESNIGRSMGAITPEHAGAESGPKILAVYPDPIVFTTRR